MEKPFAVQRVDYGVCTMSTGMLVGILCDNYNYISCHQIPRYPPRAQKPMSSMASDINNDQINEYQSQAQAGCQQDSHDAETEKQIEDETIQVKTEDVSTEDSPPQPPYSTFTSTQKGWILFIAAWAGWFSTASSFIYFPAIPFLADDMNVSVQDINLTVTSYLIASGIFPTVTGSVADIFGRRITLMVSLTAYAAINVGLATQRSYAALFILRMLQSVAISGK